MLFICYPKCTTCLKAKKYLEANNIEFVERDIKLVNPTKEELKKYWTLSNVSLDKMFNTSGLVYRSLNVKEKLKTMTDEEKLDLLASDGMLVKRPILVLKDKVLFGFKLDKWSLELQIQNKD